MEHVVRRHPRRFRCRRQITPDGCPGGGRSSPRPGAVLGAAVCSVRAVGTPGDLVQPATYRRTSMWSALLRNAISSVGSSTGECDLAKKSQVR